MTAVPSRREFVREAGTVLGASATLGFPSVLLPDRDRTSRVALCGLGSYATGQLAPGLQKTEHGELRGIVTGSPEEIPRWQQRYDIPDRNVYSYETPPGVHAKRSD